MRRSNRKRKAASVALENNDTPTSSTDGAQSQENLIRDHPGKSSQLLQSTESLPSNPKSPLGVRRSSRRNKTLDSTALGKETNEECELQGKDAHEGIAKPQKRSNAAVSKTKKRQSIRKNSSTALASPKISSNPIDEPFESLTSTSVTAGAELTSSSRNDESSHGPQMEGSRNPGEDIQQLSEAVHNSPLRQKELQDVEPRGQVTGERSAHTPSPVFSKEAEDITSVRVAEPEGAEATSEALEPRENGTLEAISKAQSPKPLDVEEARESQNQFSRSSGLPVAQFAEAGSVGQAAIGNVHGTGIADDPMVGPNNLMARSNAQNKPVSRVPEHFISSHGSSSIPDPEQLALPQQPYIKPHASSPQPMSSYDNARPRKSLPPLAPKTPSVSEDASQGPEQNRGLQSEPHHLSQFHTPFFGRLDGQYFQASLESETRSIYGDQFRTPSSSYPVPVTIPYATPYGNKQPKKSQSTSESSAARPMSVSMYGTFIAQDPPSVRADQPMPATPVESQLHTPNTLQPLLQHDPSTTFSYQSHQQTTSTGYDSVFSMQETPNMPISTSDRGAEGRGRGRGRGKARRRGRGRGLFSGVMEGNLSDDMIAQLSSQLVGLDPDQTDDFSTKLGKRTRASSRGRPRGRPRGRAAGRMGDVQNTRDLLPSPSPMIDPRLLSPEKTNQPQINGNWAYQYPTGIGNLNGSAQNCSANQSDYHVGAERSFSSKMPLEYSQVPRGGPINRYPKLAPAPPSNYPLGLNDLPKESSPLSDEDFVVRRPNETLDSFQSRAAFESAAAQARARHRALYEDSESNSEEESGEEHEQRSDSDSASEDEAIQTNDGYISDADSDYLDYKQSMSKLSKDVNKLRGLNDEEQNTAGSGRGGIKRRRGRGKGSNPHRGPRKPKELTGPIKLRLGKATQLFIGQQHDEAMALVDEVIGINSETYEAWTLKASLFQERGNIESAIESLWVAAHLRHKHVDPWFNCAALCLEGTGASRALYLPRAQRCFANAARCQPTNLQAYLGKADVYFEREMFPMAVNTYEHILKKVRPHSLEVMRRVGESAIAAFHAGIANGETAVTAGRAEIEVAINRYTKEIAHFKSNPDDFDEEIGWSEVLAYSELFIFDGRYERAIKELSSLARWLVGREEESFWEDFTENDAEWDISNSRRSGVPSFKPDAFTPESYGLGLPLELRAKLGIYRLRLGHEDEAMLHLKSLDISNKTGENIVQNNHYICSEVAEALCAIGKFAMALEFFKILKESPEIFTANMYTQMGTCYLDQEEEVEAESCFQRAADMDQNNTEARGHLANLFRKQGKQKQALDMANHVVQLIQLQNVPRPKRRYGKYLRDPAPPLAAGPMAAAKPLMPLQPKPAAGEPREDTPSLGIGIGTGKIVAQPMAKPVLTPEDRLLAEAETSKLLATQYLILSRQRDRMRAGVFEGVRQWTKAARLLTNDFRSFKAFYPQDKSLKFSGYSSADVRQASTPLRDDMRAMASQLSQDIGAKVQDRSNRIPNGFGDTYRGMSFDAWLDIFMEFAICLAKRGKLKESYEMCQAAKDCVIFFHSRNDMFLLHLSWCMCAIMLNDYQTLMTIARFFLTDYQFTTDAYRMFTALARTCRGAVSWFNSGPTMKFILKQIKAMDYSITPASERTAEQDAERGLYTAVDQDGRLIINDDLDISLLMLYGYMLSLSENYLEALNYFMRAYALDPENPMISLSVGLTHIHHGLKSPSGIKNQNILQALTFLHQYYDIRKESEHLEERLEAHYNLGRAYQLLGLTHLAVPYYQQVLQENQDDVAEDVVMDTAFNLQNIYAIAGNMKLAMHITNKYLVI